MFTEITAHLAGAKKSVQTFMALSLFYNLSQTNYSISRVFLLCYIMFTFRKVISFFQVVPPEKKNHNTSRQNVSSGEKKKPHPCLLNISTFSSEKIIFQYVLQVYFISCSFYFALYFIMLYSVLPRLTSCNNVSSKNSI